MRLLRMVVTNGRSAFCRSRFDIAGVFSEIHICLPVLCCNKEELHAQNLAICWHSYFIVL